MSDLNHTSGPWRWSENRWNLESPDGIVLQTESEENNYGYNAGFQPSKEDAQLIAAAPQMLEALIRIRSLIDESEGIFGFHLNGALSEWFEHQEDIDAIEEAIAKATGKEVGDE